MQNDVNVILGGAAGQGLDTVAHLLCKAVVRSGRHVLTAPHVMSRVRGGHNNFRMRISAEPVPAPADAFHMLAAMTEESVLLHRDKLVEGGLLVTDAAWDLAGTDFVPVPYAELAPRQTLRSAVLFGVLGTMLGFAPENLADLLGRHFRNKGEDVVRDNLGVLDKTVAWTAAHASVLTLPEAGREPLLAMTGNQAVVLGALAADVGFCAYYPMSPATPVAEGLGRVAQRMDIVVEQAEDEIGAANMALGAAYGGARSIVPTSGGGFALMTEAVSLAGVMEMPVVFNVVQRPGPATGLATRTEQADLDLVLYAGHGEFPRAVLAPATVEDCFHLTRTAFDLTERAQTPVFLLTDQYLGDSLMSVPPFDLDALAPVAGPNLDDDGAASYRRYALPGPVSPRRIPGHGQSLVLVDSHEHDETGHIIEGAAMRVAMQDKRQAKLEVLKRLTVPPLYHGADNPELLLVGWGSTVGALRESVNILVAQGTRAACLGFTQVWPLVPEQFMGRLTGARRVVAVEGNSTAQFAGLLRRETGFHIASRVLRYDGRAFTAGYVLDGLRRIGEGI